MKTLPPPTLTLTLGKRLLLLLCIFIIGFFIVGVVSSLVMMAFGTTTQAMRIVTVLQDVLAFIAPAVITAVMVTRQPATLLCIDSRPPLNPTLIGFCTLLCSIPAMNYVIWLNTNVPLPTGIHDALMAMEDNANAAIESLMGEHTVGNLIVSILIVGVFAGLSEELLFRGGLQRLLVTGGVSHHMAIWTTAFFFSLLHMQFFGFVPRLLLGAFFGYMLYWTGSLWVPIILHALNNTIYVIAEWLSYGTETPSKIDSIGSGTDFAYVVISLILTIIGLTIIQRTVNSE